MRLQNIFFFATLILILQSCGFFTDTEKKIIELSDYENSIKLGDSSNDDLITSLLMSTDKISFKGEALNKLRNDVSIVFSDTTDSGKSSNISVEFVKGNWFEFSLIFKPVLEEGIIIPEIQTLNFKSELPIIVKRNKKSIAEFSAFYKTDTDLISDIRAVSIINILSVIFNETLYNNDISYSFDRKLTGFPPIRISNFSVDLGKSDERQTLSIGNYNLTYSSPATIRLKDFDLKDNISSFGVQEAKFAVHNFTITETQPKENDLSFDFKAKKGLLELKNYILKYDSLRYSVERGALYPKSYCYLFFDKGDFNTSNNFLQKGKFDNITFTLKDYSYKYDKLNNNSIVEGEVITKGKFTELKSLELDDSNGLSYVISEFSLDNFIAKYEDDGYGKIKSEFEVPDIVIPFDTFRLKEDNQFELFGEDINLSISKTTVDKIRDIQISSDQVKINSSNLQLKLIKDKINLDLPQGVSLDLHGLDTLRLFDDNYVFLPELKLNNKIPEIRFDFKVKRSKEQIIIKNVQSSLRVSAEGIEGNILFDNNSFNNLTPLIAKELNVIGSVNLQEIDIFIKDSLNYIEFKNTGLSLKKDNLIQLANDLIDTNLEGKRFNNVGYIKAAVIKTGIDVKIKNADIKKFDFTSLNKFEFSINGGAKCYSKLGKPSFTINNASGTGVISYPDIVNKTLSNLEVKVETDYVDGTVDLDNFPGSLEKGVGAIRQALGSPLQRTELYKPFAKIRNSFIKQLCTKTKVLDIPQMTERNGNINVLVPTIRLKLNDNIFDEKMKQAFKRPSSLLVRKENTELDEEVFIIVDDMPRFSGCEVSGYTNDERKKCAEKKMLEFIYENINYPIEDKQNDVEGMVVLTFVIEKDGSISDPKVSRDLGKGCGEEALRLVKSMPDWIPGKQNNQPVRVQFNLPIRFKLEG